MYNFKIHSRLIAAALSAAVMAPTLAPTSLTTLPVQAAPVADLTAQAVQLKVLCDNILAQVTKPGMDKYQQLNAAYVYVMDHTDYQRNTEIPSGEWTVPYALEALSTGKGNCYRFNVAFAYLASDLGFPAKIVTGTCKSTNGGQTPHGWCMLNIGGEWRYFDPDMQDANRNVNFFNVSYEEYKDSRKPLIAEAEYPVGFSAEVAALAAASETATQAAQSAQAQAAATAAAQAAQAAVSIVPYGYYQTPQGVMWSNGDGTFKRNETFTFGGQTWTVDGNGFIQVPKAAAVTANTAFGQNVMALLGKITN